MLGTGVAGLGLLVTRSDGGDIDGAVIRRVGNDSSPVCGVEACRFLSPLVPKLELRNADPRSCASTTSRRAVPIQPVRSGASRICGPRQEPGTEFHNFRRATGNSSDCTPEMSAESPVRRVTAISFTIEASVKTAVVL